MKLPFGIGGGSTPPSPPTQLNRVVDNATNYPQPAPSTTPSMTLSFPELTSMPTEELEKALIDNVAFEKLVAKVFTNKSTLDAKDGELFQLKKQTEELAQANIAIEAKIEDIRRHIAIIKSTEYDPAKQAYEEKYARHTAAREHISPETLVSRLGDAAKAAEQEAAAIEQKFRAGGIDTESFVSEYADARKLFHVRDMKYRAALQTIPLSKPTPSSQQQTLGR